MLFTNPRSAQRVAMLGALLAAAGCKRASPRDDAHPPANAASATSSAAPREPATPPARWTGSALARSADDRALYLADEDAGVVRRVALPFVAGAGGSELKVGGPPAQVLARKAEMYVTRRDPSAVVALVDDPDGGLREGWSVALPGDAWGMALSPDETTLLVTSAWTHKLSVVDVKTHRVLATLDVPREPRGVVFAPDGKKAWVTHLMGTAVTRVDLAGAESKVAPVALPAGPHRTPRGARAGASLAYAPVISPDGTRLLVPRHALGTVSFDPGPNGWGRFGFAWWGTSSVDVLLLRDETPLMPPRAEVATIGRFDAAEGIPKKPMTPDQGSLPASHATSFLQPRDGVYRRSSDTLLVASEGSDEVLELDALALDPSLAVLARYRIDDGVEEKKPTNPVAHVGNAPQAIALSADETIAYVWARGSRGIVSFPLSTPGRPRGDAPASTHSAVFPEPLGKDAALGRRLFYYGNDDVMSGGLGCAGCHPDGRDDGFVWRDGRHAPREHETRPSLPVFFGHPAALFDAAHAGYPRQTPMLAGRVGSEGPYGWHAQSRTVAARLLEGFSLHRWAGGGDTTAYQQHFRITQLTSFLRTGLRPPPRDTSPLTPEEEKGRALFEDQKTQCASCHPGATEYTTRAPIPLKRALPTLAGFAKEDDESFRVPSLLFVDGTPPYYHDGSASTLQELIDKNGNRMGDTSHLSASERAALVAYLRRL